MSVDKLEAPFQGVKVLHCPKSNTRGRSGMVSVNSFMEVLVELPDGQRTYMTQKEVNKFNNQHNGSI